MDKMLNPMMKRYQMFAWLGLIIVLIAFISSLSVAGANTVWFSVTKATRETAAVGTDFVAANALRHSYTVWVPAFKFLGLGIMLGAITMALGVIIKTLRDLGSEVMATWPDKLNPGLPTKPPAAKLFPMIMMMGWIVLIVGLVWAINISGVASSYFAHSVASELNPAQAGSALLAQLGAIKFAGPWLAALRFTGMTLLFTAITVALTVIIRTLQFQEKSLQRFLDAHSS